MSETQPQHTTQNAPQAPPTKRYPPGSFNTLYWWYLGLAIGGAVLIVTIILSLLGFPAIIASAVFAAIFMYRAWDQIQDGQARTSPALAVGLSFVPLFNFYWVYISVWGLAKDINLYTERHNIAAPKVNEALALGMCVLMSVGLLAGLIPFVNFAVWIALLIVGLVTMNEFRKASMAIAASGA
ncbi:MAG: hypothetical protein H6813_00940 [Phycisphaeraceae bacterium]|nr:hypothetical protein [Phycisphaeraceae bacterium]MCB9847348.1 hypothetical protein [Phycisphaeraceae bacterium]